MGCVLDVVARVMGSIKRGHVEKHPMAFLKKRGNVEGLGAFQPCRASSGHQQVTLNCFVFG